MRHDIADDVRGAVHDDSVRFASVLQIPACAGAGRGGQGPSGPSGGRTASGRPGQVGQGPVRRPGNWAPAGVCRWPCRSGVGRWASHAWRGAGGFNDIVQAMREWQVSARPVLDDTGHVVGFVSEADLLPKEQYSGGGAGRYGQVQDLAEVRKANAVTAGELMTTPAVIVAPDSTLARLARGKARNGGKRLPVVGRDVTLKGIVSRPDLLKIFLRDEAIVDEVRRDVVVRLFDTHTQAIRAVDQDGSRPTVGAAVRAASVS
ncbi:CBS domain-containing protein [Streptomyces sp. NPDC055059]